MYTSKNGKKFWKPGKFYEKTSGNPVIYTKNNNRPNDNPKVVKYLEFDPQKQHYL